MRTVDDSSPLVLFEPAGAWQHADGQGYTNGTYSSSAVSGATAKFSFSGTAFWVYGAKKAGYGQYILTLDDEVALYADATASASQDELGQVLGGKAGLSDGQHTVVLMAAGGGPVDVDAFVFETAEGGGQQGCVDLVLVCASSVSHVR